ncbi:endolytic transglycosylase MltG [Sinomonas sp. ASV322]|uniref:endolytic transglycosylase MltG n=1 Tax=Sinomonas sp. ASV322 TaxID=3041920 RepID=UPI0027DD3421|nr:endolytic transglycosylase MltG [Sinomonas sp. ASV322]MDQ4501144.1 endolytic transglycosylase MltG [Sinomonas sp. ASV322]
MDPQDTDFRSTPEQPLTRREIRERERAQAEARQRMLSASDGTSPSSVRRTAEPGPVAAAAAAASSARTADDAARRPDPGSKGASTPLERPRAASTASDATGIARGTAAVQQPGESPTAPNPRPRSGASDDWPAPLPASATRLAVKGAPVYEAEERIARGLYGADSSTPGRRAAADDSGLSVLKRAEAVRAARSLDDATGAGPLATTALDGGPTPADGASDGADGRHSDAALGHHAGGSVAVVEPVAKAPAAGGLPAAGAARSAQAAVPAEPAAVHAEPAPDDRAALPLEPSTVHETVFANAELVKAKPRRSRQFKALVSLGIALALIVAASFVGAALLRPILGMDKVTDYPGPGTGQVVVTVKPGSAARAVAQDLQQQGVIADTDTFLKVLAATNASIHPGDFTFKKQMKASDAAAILTDDGSKVVYFALSAGLRINDSLDTIAKSAHVDRKDLDALNGQPAQFGLPAQAKNLEGYLEPGEYRFPVGTSAKDILTKLVSTRLDELKQDGITDPAKQYEVLTIASIVQAEGGQADYGNVAGAIYNRLKPNDQTRGLIQSDATVTYGLGTKTVQLTDAQKADGGNAYNTYVHQGLPPGPIGSPGSKAVAAAAHPTANNYLYWVTVNLDSGETKFASTYAEHQANVAQYTQWCAANAGKCQ